MEFVTMYIPATDWGTGTTGVQMAEAFRFVADSSVKPLVKPMTFVGHINTISWPEGINFNCGRSDKLNAAPPPSLPPSPAAPYKVKSEKVNSPRGKLPSSLVMILIGI